MTERDATPASETLAKTAVLEERIATIAYDMAKLAWAELDRLQLGVQREKLPAIAMEIATEAAGMIIATAASEKSGQVWIDQMMPLFTMKTHAHAMTALRVLADEPATARLVKP